MRQPHAGIQIHSLQMRAQQALHVNMNTRAAKPGGNLGSLLRFCASPRRTWLAGSSEPCLQPGSHAAGSGTFCPHQPISWLRETLSETWDHQVLL